MTDRIFGFRDEHFFLSNFYIEDFDGLSGEHRFQASKAMTEDWRQRILTAPTPAKAKYHGRSVPLRPDWEDIKLGVMVEVVRQKFSDRTLRLKLLGTGNAELVEANSWGDTYWGTDMNGAGQNVLGRILMEHRAHLVAAIAKQLTDPEKALTVAPFAAAYIDAVRR